MNAEKIRFRKGLSAGLVLALATSVLVAGCSSPENTAKSEPETHRPNVVIINADDIGYGDLSCYGAKMVRTPNIDRLAKEGRRFLDAHSASAVCSPSRYALVTGEYPFRKDLWAPIFLRHPLVVDTNRATMATVMKQAGYATAVIGKWHLGFQTEEPVDWNKELKPGPLELGFDYYFGVPILNSHPPFVFVENHRVVGWTPDDPFVYGKRANTAEFQEKMGLSDIGGADSAHALYKDREVGTTLMKKAVEFIQDKKDRPFFLYLATTNIHHPFTPATAFVGTSEAGRYGDFIHELDWIVGEVLKTLDEEGLADNTLVIFTSDNGGMLNQGGQDAYAAGHHQNGELFGFKFDAWEGGHRIPFIARWPGKIPGGSESNQLISHVDMVATLASLTGVSLEEDDAPDSYNVLPAIVGDPQEPIRDHLLIHPFKKTHLSLRKGKWMYIGAQGGGGFSAPHVGDHGFGDVAATVFTGQQNSDIENGKLKPDAPPAQLYDLEADFKQSTNLYNRHPEVVQEMKDLMAKILSSPRSAPRIQQGTK